MDAILNQRRFVVLVEVFYLLILFALAVIYLTDLHTVWHVPAPASLGSLPVGVPWFGALGAVMISLSGAFDHRQDWDPRWNLWHFTRPLIGIAVAIVACLIFEAGILAVGPTNNSAIPNASTATATPTAAPTTGTSTTGTSTTGTSTTATSATGTSPVAPSYLLYYLIAFLVGYRESVFRDLIKRVADVILSPGASPSPPAVVTAIAPPAGAAAGGGPVTITGRGLTGTTGVKFGTATALFRVDSDQQITATIPAGTGTVDVTISSNGQTVTGGQFTYQ